MKTRTFRPPQDRLDLEALEAMTASHGWRMFEQKLDDTIAQIEKSLRTCTAGELEVLQAKIHLLEQVKQMPGVMGREIARSCP